MWMSEPMPGDDQDHHRRQVIEPELQRHLQAAGCDPAVVGSLPARGRPASAAGSRTESAEVTNDSSIHQAGDAPRDGLRQLLSEESVDHEAGQRQQRNQEQHQRGPPTTSTW